MGIAGKTSTMNGTILTALALLVASCQMKPAKHFLVETKTKTDDEPARKGDDYMNIGRIGTVHGSVGGNHVAGNNMGRMGGNHFDGGNNSGVSIGQSGGTANTQNNQKRYQNQLQLNNHYQYWG